MPDLLAKKSSLEARYAELNQRLQAIQQDYARGLDADSEERAQELQNADVLAEIKRVTQEDLAKIAAELTQVTQLLAKA
jgi:ABC-type phosphate transport system auxiliary subunit